MKKFTIKPYVYPEEGSNDNWIIRLKVFNRKGEEIKKREQFFSGYYSKQDALKHLDSKIERLKLEIEHNSMTSQEAEDFFNKLRNSLKENSTFNRFYNSRNPLQCL